MNHAGHGAHNYLQTQVRSSSPLELVVMLYDAALRHCATASEAMTRRDIPARRHALSKAMAIVSELQSTLDMKNGGTLAQDLDDLYGWMTTQLVHATVTQKAGPIDDVRRVLETLRDGWRQIATKAPGSAA